MRVRVAGGAGLVGQHLCLELARRGVEVAATRHHAPVLGVPSDPCDLTRFDDCLAVTRGFDCVAICAIEKSGTMLEATSPTAEILPTLQIVGGLLEACSRNGVANALLMSSATVYPECTHPIREDALDHNVPPSPLYEGVGEMHRYLERLAAHYTRVSKTQVTIVRATSMYGPHDRFGQGANVLAALVRRAVEKIDPFVVWGDGSAVRDFYFAADTARDLADLIARPLPGIPLNLGSGVASTVREAVDAVLAESGHAVQPTYDTSRPTASLCRTVDISRLEAHLGTRARTSLQDGLRQTIHWYRQASDAERRIRIRR
ncbi:MAG: NAD-dependent epimerase/dehydratase family protein [Proteobacteria bacterium]|nr:NAD-dependent epimerase/dehydratase family protein [Pseudomonadota bacterium]